MNDNFRNVINKMKERRLILEEETKIMWKEPKEENKDKILKKLEKFEAEVITIIPIPDIKGGEEGDNRAVLRTEIENLTLRRDSSLFVRNLTNFCISEIYHKYEKTRNIYFYTTFFKLIKRYPQLLIIDISLNEIRRNHGKTLGTITRNYREKFSKEVDILTQEGLHFKI